MGIKLDYDQVIDLCKKGNIKRLRYEDFITGVLETLSDSSVTHKYPKRLALKVLADFIEVGNRLDQLKKALFYGKDLEEVIRKHQAIYNFNEEFTEDDEWELEDNSALHGILGLATEDVELIEAAYKVFSGTRREFDVVNLIEEIGDSEFYKAVLIYSLSPGKDIDLRLKKIWANVLLKLNLRYEGKFTEDKAIFRDLKKERELLDKQALS